MENWGHFNHLREEILAHIHPFFFLYPPASWEAAQRTYSSQSVSLPNTSPSLFLWSETCFWSCEKGWLQIRRPLLISAPRAWIDWRITPEWRSLHSGHFKHIIQPTATRPHYHKDLWVPIFLTGCYIIGGWLELIVVRGILELRCIWMVYKSCIRSTLREAE